MKCELEDKIFEVNRADFSQLALRVFRFQHENNAVFRQFCDLRKCDAKMVSAIDQIPFLPVSFFKNHLIKTTHFEPELTFESSGTTGQNSNIRSRHLIKHVSLYQKSFRSAFRQFYGSPDSWCILGLLPSYLERSNSSLVFMVDDLIRETKHPMSGFYLSDFERLKTTLIQLENEGQKTLLIGVTFALLDFAASHSFKLYHTTVMETGGMKGRKQELIRAEVHNFIKTSFGLSTIHAEYGMTELLSQAYSKRSGVFQTPSWMKVLVRLEDDPTSVSHTGTGLINIIDLANLYSCSFIATDDIGNVRDEGFEVEGRMDNSDLRGCSLLVA